MNTYYKIGFFSVNYNLRQLLIQTLTFMFCIVIFGNCTKVGEKDPRLSLRSREKRLIGKWSITRVYYYDGKLGGIKNDGDTFVYYQELYSDNRLSILDSKGSVQATIGNWYWLNGNQSFKEKETVGIMYNGKPIVELHYLSMLKYDKILSIEYVEAPVKQHYYKHYWSRIGK